MNLKYQFNFFIVLFLLFLSPVYADTSLSLECPNTSTAGSTIQCNVLVTSDIELSGIETKLSVGSNLELIKFTTNPIWQGSGDGGNIQLYTYPNQKGKVSLGTASIKIVDDKNSNTGTIFLENTIFYQSEFKELKGNNPSVNIRLLSTNNELSSITLDKGSLSPSFNKNTLKYQLTLDSDHVMIGAVASDKKATVSGVGNKELKEGENTFIITVTSEAGEKREYQIVITRPIKKQDNSVKKEESSNSSSTTDNKDSNQAENKSHQESNSSSNLVKLKLKELVVEGYDLNFQEDKNTYDLLLSKDEKSLKIKAVSPSNEVKVTISGNENLKVGKNTIFITLEDKEGNKSTYTIVATKKSKTCVVKDIQVKGYKLGFDCNQDEYQLSIKDEDMLNIDAVAISQDTKINIYGNSQLKDGSVITIIFKQDKEEYQYSIKISKEKDVSTNLIDNKKGLIFIGIAIAGLLYLIGRFMVKKKFLKIKN